MLPRDKLGVRAYVYATFYWAIIRILKLWYLKGFYTFQSMSFTQRKWFKVRFVDTKHELWKPQELQLLQLGHNTATMIGLILETEMLRLLQPTPRTYVKTVMLKLRMLWQNGAWKSPIFMEGKLKKANINMSHTLLISFTPFVHLLIRFFISWLIS